MELRVASLAQGLLACVVVCSSVYGKVRPCSKFHVQVK